MMLNEVDMKSINMYDGGITLIIYRFVMNVNKYIDKKIEREKLDT